MTRFIVDSCGWLEYFSKGRLSEAYGKWIEQADKENCFIPSVVLHEVYKHLKRERNEEQALRATGQITARATIIDLDEGLALESADISLAEKLPLADSVVMATAKRFNALVVTSDAHFKNLEGVKFIGK